MIRKIIKFIDYIFYFIILLNIFMVLSFFIINKIKYDFFLDCYFFIVQKKKSSFSFTFFHLFNMTFFNSFSIVISIVFKPLTFVRVYYFRPLDCFIIAFLGFIIIFYFLKLKFVLFFEKFFKK